jgi:four helix bundle protein
MAKFRFMDLEIWKEAISLNDHFMDIADIIEDKKKFRFAEQLRAASLSISNNIAEGSGSYSSKDFANFLNIARRSVFEVVNILVVANRRKYIKDEELDQFLTDLEILSRKISNFRKTILKD